MTIGRRPGGWFKYAWMANPVTPIVLIFQRAIYARLDNPKIPPGSVGHEILPHWGMGAYVGYLGYSLVFGIIMFAIGIAVFGAVKRTSPRSSSGGERGRRSRSGHVKRRSGVTEPTRR